MAQHVEPMDVDSSVCEFDNKENTCHSNVLPRTPCTEKGYEELDVSELNMKLRYSITPASSPMSKSYTANCLDNRNFEVSDSNIENGNLTRSLHSATSPDGLVKSQKVIPLQSLPTDQLDCNRNALRSLDCTVKADNGDITVTVSGPNDDEIMSFPSSSSSMAHTPEATTPTKDIPKSDGSPILRGLKSVLNMFRPSQSPIPPEDESEAAKEVLSPPIVTSPNISAESRQAILASTPLMPHKTKEAMLKRNSPNRDSLVFNEDLEKELEWKEDSTIIFNQEKIPIHKLFYQQSKQTHKIINDITQQDVQEKLDTTVEFMDVSYNDSIRDKTMSEIQVDVINRSDVIVATESDSEFVDCETTFSKNDSQVSFKSQENDLDEVVESKPSLNVTGEILDATVSVKSTDVSINSTETTRASINTSVSESINVPGVPNNIKNEDFGRIPCPATAGHNLFPCEPQSDNNVDNISKTLTLVEPQIVKRDVTKSIESPVAINEQNILDCGLTNVIEPISTLNVTNAQPEIVNEIAHNISGLGNVGVISQIPLISDPRVLLFNLSQDPIDIQVPQSTESLGTLPVDIPLPDDDDDIEKIASLLTEEPNLKNNVICKLPTDVIKINETNIESVDDIIRKIDVEETETTDYDSLPEVKALLANIEMNKDVIIPQQIMALKSTEFIGKEQYIIESDVVTTVKENMEVAVNAQEIQSPAVNEETKDAEVLFDANQTKNDSLFADKIVADDKAFIPQVEDIPFELRETQELCKDTCDELSVTERKEPEQEPSENEFAAPIILTNKSVSEYETVSGNEIIIQPPVDVKIKEDKLAVAIEMVANDNKIETKEATSVDTVLDTIIVSDSDTVMQLSMSTPIAFTEEIITPEEENNKTIEEIALDIVNKTIEIATSPIVEDSKLDSELKETHETNAITVTPNVDIVTVISTVNQGLTTTFKEENNILLTSEETPIVSKYITNHTELDVITNEIATVDFISSDSKNSVVAETDMLEENVINVIKVANLDDAAPIVETIQEEKPLNITLNQATERLEDKMNTMDEEIIASENNSPFVSVTADSELDSEAKQIDNFEEIENPFKTQTTIAMSPPSSPKIISKGYNFNFDEIDDPFATKTKIRQSPPPGATPNHSFDQMDTSFGKTEVPKRDVNKNRRKSQPERRKPGSANKKLNSTVGTLSVDLKTPKKVDSNKEYIVEKTEDKASAPTGDLNITNNISSLSLALPAEQIEHDVSMTKLPEIRNNTFDGHEMVCNIFTKSNALNLTSEMKNEDKFQIDGVVEPEEVMNAGNQSIETETKNTSSSEHSTYYSAGTSSSELVGSKNVFNLPEIDDINFNPFVTKSKMRQSPLPCLQIDETVVPNLEGVHAPDSTIVIEHNHDTTIDISLPKDYAQDSTMVIEQNHDKTIDISSPKDYAQDSTMVIEQNHDKTTYISSPKGYAPDSTMVIEQNHDKTIDVSSPKNDAPDSTIVIEPNHDTTINVSLPKELSSNVDKISEGKKGAELEDKDSSNNISYATSSSKATDDNDNTVREVNTEDEDTIEGPFLESEDLNNDEKMPDYDCENDMMQFTDIPPQENDDNADAGEFFIDAEAFEFLLNQNKTNVVTDSGKESLFLKFDPLFAKRMSSDGVLAALSKVQKRQSTPKKISKHSKDSTFVQKSPVAGPSNLNATCDVDISNQQQDESNDDLKFTVSKPMMVVNPAVNPVATPRNKSVTPTRTNRRSLTFTSPAIAVIDRLLSMSANNSLAGHETTVAEVSREQNEADHALTQLRELLADKEINVYNLRTESKQLKERLANLESQMKSLEAVSEERLKKINELTDKLNEKTRMNKSMATVVEEYERTIASLISETEQDKKRHAQERIELIKERDEQTAHLASMEVSFSDLHSKYEKSKQMIIGFKTNEETYKKSIKDFEESLTKMQNNYELLKQHATSKLNHANDELQKMNRSHEAEVLKLNAMIKRKELHITSLEETLLQKTKANEELTAICDELINKVG